MNNLIIIDIDYELFNMYINIIRLLIIASFYSNNSIDCIDYLHRSFVRIGIL
jgi:hypothetical protein